MYAYMYQNLAYNFHIWVGEYQEKVLSMKKKLQKTRYFLQIL